MAGWAPAPLFGAYNASKHAVVAFSEVLAHEIRDTGVRLCCVCPPPVDTPMIAPGNAPAKSLRHRVLSPISAAQVLDAIERDLGRDRLFCFPDLPQRSHLARAPFRAARAVVVPRTRRRGLR